MMFAKGIELQCFIHDETTDTLEELGISHDYSFYESEPLTFYNIDAIAPYETDDTGGKQYSEVMSGGKSFICTLDYETLKTKIQNDTKV